MVLCAAVRGKTMNTFRQTAVGVFVLLGLICVGYLTIKLGKMEVVTDKGFELSATFNSVSGLRVGADVELAGVPVGRVTNIVLTDDMRAKVLDYYDENYRSWLYLASSEKEFAEIAWQNIASFMERNSR